MRISDMFKRLSEKKVIIDLKKSNATLVDIESMSPIASMEMSAIDKRHMNRGIFATIAAVISAMIGAVIGIMFAPSSGKESREKVAKSWDEMVVRSKEFSINANEQVHKLLHELKEDVSTLQFHAKVK
ncbi:MAG: YtxH domain-containing protein [Nitrospirae bacterium]|nr:YtxH domain-containing protein [Nitrospirota bacterium]MBF0539948.1 YtxH domain-containing protein [Nitrospirota bacterium]